MNTYQKLYDGLMEREVDRREFLAYAGAVLLAVLGIKGILHAILGASHKQEQPKARPGYGGGSYGK